MVTWQAYKQCRITLVPLGQSIMWTPVTSPVVNQPCCTARHLVEMQSWQGKINDINAWFYTIIAGMLMLGLIKANAFKSTTAVCLMKTYHMLCCVDLDDMCNHFWSVTVYRNELDSHKNQCNFLSLLSQNMQGFFLISCSFTMQYVRNLSVNAYHLLYDFKCKCIFKITKIGT